MGLLAILDVLIGFVHVPVQIAIPASIVLSILTVGAPIFAIYRASFAQWTPKLALVCLISGIFFQVLFLFAARHFGHVHGFLDDFVESTLFAVSQMGLLTWCLGFGGLLSSLIKEKNLLLPISIFLAAFDCFLVLTPQGFTRQIIEKHPQILANVGYSIPKMTSESHFAPIISFATIGPADFLFLGMFFVALARFNMQSVKTVKWMIPILLGYLAVVVLFGGFNIGPIHLNELPALLPIGSVVLLVNRKEWVMNKEEKTATLVVAAIGIGLVAFGFSRHAHKTREESQPLENQTISKRFPGSKIDENQVKSRSIPSGK